MRGARPATAILRALAGNVLDLARAEINLGRTELRENTTRYLVASAPLVAGAVGSALAAALLLLALVRVLETALPRWAAAAVLAIPIAGGGLALLREGVARFRAAGRRSQSISS